MTAISDERRGGDVMLKIKAPPDVALEREKTNRALAREGWGPTLRLKFLRIPVAPGVLIFAAAPYVQLLFR